jgi:lysophospholipase L1-like esterase
MLRILFSLGLLLGLLPHTRAQDRDKPGQKEKGKAAARAQESKDAAVTPNDRKDSWWQQRHAKVLERNKEGKVDVLFIGDSITQGWEGGGKEEWQKHFAPLHAVNLGFSGDRTQHVLWRLGEGGEMAGIVPKAAVIMIGTNNSGNNSAEQIADGITAIVKLIRKKHPRTKILLLGVFPRSAKATDPIRAKLKDVNDRIRQLDDGENVKFLDIGEKFLDKEGNLTKEIMPDYLHLSTAGYKIWAEAIAGPVEEMVGK